MLYPLTFLVEPEQKFESSSGSGSNLKRLKKPNKYFKLIEPQKTLFFQIFYSSFAIFSWLSEPEPGAGGDRTRTGSAMSLLSTGPNMTVPSLFSAETSLTNYSLFVLSRWLALTVPSLFALSKRHVLT